jgi:hypothetical protein
VPAGNEVSLGTANISTGLDRFSGAGSARSGLNHAGFRNLERYRWLTAHGAGRIGVDEPDAKAILTEPHSVRKAILCQSPCLDRQLGRGDLLATTE